MHWGVPLFAAAVVGLASGGAVLIHNDMVTDDMRDARAVSAQNAYVRMISKTSTPHNDEQFPGVQHLARFVKPALGASNPIQRLLDVHVPVKEFNNVNHILAVDVAYMETGDAGDENPRTGEVGDGELTSEFILLTVAALDDPQGMIQDVKPPRADGIYTWRNAALLAAVPIALYTIFYLPIALGIDYFKAQRARRKHDKWWKSLSSEAREIWNIREKLAKNKPSTGYYSWEQRKYKDWLETPEGKAWSKADEAFTLATDGWTNTEHDDQLARLTNELNDLVQAIRTGQQTYRDM